MLLKLSLFVMYSLNKVSRAHYPVFLLITFCSFFKKYAASVSHKRDLAGQYQKHRAITCFNIEKYYPGLRLVNWNQVSLVQFYKWFHQASLRSIK